jgi:hypothetical protein
MSKYPKWKVNVSVQNYFTVEVDAESEEKAIQKAIKEVRRNADYYDTGNATLVTGVFINDREARNFCPYIPDTLPRETATNYLPKTNESVDV